MLKKKLWVLHAERSTNWKNVAVQTNLTEVESLNTLSDLRRDKKNLQQLARRNAHVSNLIGMMKLLKNSVLNDTAVTVTEGNFDSSIKVGSRFEYYSWQCQKKISLSTLPTKP